MHFSTMMGGVNRRFPALRRGLVIGTLAVVCAGLLTVQKADADAKSALPPTVDNYKFSKAGIQMFTPATLENHLDGEAEALKRYDFKSCAYAEYAPGGQGNQFITADVFEFGAPIDAYGYYTSQRNARAKIVKIGAEGYQEESDLNFWKGPYYVRLAITATNKTSFQPELSKLAAAIAAKLSGPTTTPDIVKLLPPGYTPRTEQYRLNDIAAQSYIRNGMVAKYPSAGQQAELFVAIFPSPAAAKEAYDKYSAYLSKPTNIAVGGKVTPLNGVGEKAVSVKSRFTGEVVAALKGKYLIAVRYAADEAKGQALVKAAVARAK